MAYVIQLVAVLTSMFTLGLSVSAEENEHPIVTSVKANLKDPRKPFTILVHLKIKEGTAGKFESAFAKAIAGTRKEKGNKAYELNRSTKSPTEYVVYERWTDLAALRDHLKTPHITALLADIGDLLEGPPEAKVFLPAGD